jgi:CarD family transcriptional regulator
MAADKKTAAKPAATPAKKAAAQGSTKTPVKLAATTPVKKAAAQGSTKTSAQAAPAKQVVKGEEKKPKAAAAAPAKAPARKAETPKPPSPKPAKSAARAPQPVVAARPAAQAVPKAASPKTTAKKPEAKKPEAKAALKKPEPKAALKKPEPKKPEPKTALKKPEPKKPEPKTALKKPEPKKPEPKKERTPPPPPSPFTVGDKVVYPHHGAAVITRKERVQFQGQRTDYFVLEVATDQLILKVPVHTALDRGVRPVISRVVARKVLATFREPPEEAGANWSRWYKLLTEKINSGDIFQVAEVVRDLTFAQQTKGISPALKRMLSKARLILASELRFALDVSEEEAMRRLDKALPRVEAAEEL